MKRLWTDAELQVLRDGYAQRMGVDEIARLLGRTRDSVLQRASRLDLRWPPRDASERFWEKVDRRGPDDCWPWLGALDRKGYGAFMRTSPKPKRRVTASRMAYELAHGPIPDGHCVMHTCDNPPCCNPSHLVVGTIADNNRDMTVKGRHWRHARAA